LKKQKFLRFDLGKKEKENTLKKNPGTLASRIPSKILKETQMMVKAQLKKGHLVIILTTFFTKFDHFLPI